ncbi:Sap-like sulfolipid-1-addressing protein [Murinocardiopsis flavida]|uniref:Sap-like sulfolipid-1-addressing protein n=1 Tax=Murinocardiopsis flavida TaxID=645275 RepID=A0A2P8DUH3_9ACTN|nr:GAP family protein [Murinocardiopsis flavida]PSL00863.1 Sap-like sulfolipid-1-addressing protein [Murinocardiopsis flavida]
MGYVITAILPYAIAIIVSPVPIVAMIQLLTGADGMRKGLTFLAGWFAVCLLAPALLSPLLGEPFWGGLRHAVTGWLLLLMGAALVVLGGAVAAKVLHHPEAGVREPPRWLSALDWLGRPEAALAPAPLNVANPLNIIALLAASAVLGRFALGVGDTLLAAAVFALVCCVGIAVPVITAALPTVDSASVLQRARQTLVTYGDHIRTAVALLFGALLLWQGLTILFL